MTAARDRSAHSPPTGPQLHLAVVRAHSLCDFNLELPLDRDRLVLGRDVGCDLRLDDPGVSRRHACVERLADDSWLVSDLGSTNGLFLNGRRIANARLAEGDELRLGPTAIVRLESTGSTSRSKIPTRDEAVEARVARWTCDLEARTFTWSESVDRLLEVPPGTLSGAPASLDAVVSAEDRARFLAALEQAGRGAPISLVVQLRSGGRWLELRSDPTCGAPRPATAVSGCAWDVTSRQETSQKLRHHAALFESFSDPVALLDLEGRVLDCNSATLRLLAVAKEKLVGQTLDQPGAPEWSQAALERVRRLGRFVGESRYERAGVEVVCETVVTPLLTPGGTPMGFVAVQRDLTETHHLQRRLALADRLSAMGTLSAGIAHEINNPLAYLRANLEHILGFVTDPACPGADGEVVESVRDCAEGVERIARIVRDLKSFSRADSAQPGPTDVAQALNLARKMVGPMVKSHCELFVECPPLPLVCADEARLAQVLLNLLINAAQAMPPAREHGNKIAVRCQPSPDGVLIEVTDNGLGMAPEVLRRVFDPFFTTKPTGVGSGLGLAICHGIIEDFGGTISARSTPNEGSTFRVWLKKSEGQRPAASPDAPTALETRPLRILVIDDDARVLKGLTRMLGANHQVKPAHDATEALEAAKSAALDLVLCDVLMPGTDGLELYERLRAEVPQLAERLVFMTGGGLSSSLQARLAATGRLVLDKPLDRSQLFQVLEARARAASASASAPSDDTLRHLRLVE